MRPSTLLRIAVFLSWFVIVTGGISILLWIKGAVEAKSLPNALLQIAMALILFATILTVHHHVETLKTRHHRHQNQNQNSAD